MNVLSGLRCSTPSTSSVHLVRGVRRQWTVRRVRGVGCATVLTIPALVPGRGLRDQEGTDDWDVVDRSGT